MPQRLMINDFLKIGKVFYYKSEGTHTKGFEELEVN